MPSAVAAEAVAAAEKAAERQAEGIRSWSARLNLVIEVLDDLFSWNITKMFCKQYSNILFTLDSLIVEFKV